MSSVSLAALRDAGVALRPHEAVAIAQLLIRQPEVSEPVVNPPYGPPTPESVEVDSDGSVVCTCSATTPAVSELAILLNALLPPEITRVPGGLRYAIGRALLEVEAPPFDSIEDFSRALARFERGDRRDVVRGLLERSLAAAPAYADDSTFSVLIGREALPKPPRFVERRRAGPGADELRRQLRDADRQFYEALVAFEHGDARFPYIVGFLWNGKDAPPADHVRLRRIQSVNGHRISFIDATPSAGSKGALVIEDAHGNTISMSNGKIAIKSVAVLELTAPTITLNGRIVAPNANPI